MKATPAEYGIQSELQLLAYTTATATQDPNQICDLHHSSRQHQIPDPLSEARDQTYNLMVPSGIGFHCSTMGTLSQFLKKFFSHSGYTIAEIMLVKLKFTSGTKNWKKIKNALSHQSAKYSQFSIMAYYWDKRER